MKLNMMLLIFLLTFASCAGPGKVTMHDEERAKQGSLPTAYAVTGIEGCEYSRFYSLHKHVHITHKGNYKNPVHCTNKVYGKNQDQDTDHG